MKDIICIDLTRFNYEKLKEVAAELNIRLEMLVDNKKMGIARIYYDTFLHVVVAFTTKKNKTKIIYTDVLDDLLLKSGSFELTKRPVKLDTDSILEKISKYGIDSLLKEEKEFLDNLSK